MTKQYIRKASLIIGAGSDALDLSNLHFTFDVRATAIETPKTAYIRIYNLSSSRAKKVTEEGEAVILSAGYGDNFNVIFQGEITQARIGRENGTDTYLDITAADGDQIYNFGVANFSVAAGSTTIGRIGQIANSVGLKFGTVQAPEDGAKLARGAVYFGMARDRLRQECATIGANWCINDGKLDVIAEGGYKDGEIPVITSATGLVGIPEQTELGINFKCLLNPHLEQNMRVQIDNSLIRQFGFSTKIHDQVQVNVIPSLSADGIYIVLYVNHYGDTRGNDWYSEVVAYSAIAPTKGQLQFMPKIS